MSNRYYIKSEKLVEKNCRNTNYIKIWRKLNQKNVFGIKINKKRFRETN